jgi:SWI/SNF-related matrix-associated actin-dependent regulator of chromatin subfamily A3
MGSDRHPNVSTPDNPQTALLTRDSVNSVKDLHSIVKFLHITGGIEQSEIFNAKITRQLGSGSGSGEALLQALMHDLCLRRKKDMKFVDLKLPEKKEYIHRIAFRKDEKRKYDALL